MGHTVPPGNPPEQHHDSNPTPELSEWTRGYLAGYYDQQSGNDPQVDDPTESGTDDELLAAVDPETRALALRLNERIAHLTRWAEEADEEYERGWVDGAAKTAGALSGSGRTRGPAVTILGLLRRVEALESRLDDVDTVAEALGRARATGEPGPESPATGGSSGPTLAGRVEELESQVADLVTVAKVFATSEPDSTLADRVAAVEEKLDQLATAESIVGRATGQEPEPEYDHRYLAGYADGLAGRTLGEQRLTEPTDDDGKDAEALVDGGNDRVVPQSCGDPATRVVEAYSPAGGQAHGSLDAAYYVCGAHLATVEDAVHAAGMTAHRIDCAPGSYNARRRCGDVYDYRAAQLRRIEGGGTS